MQLFSDDTAKDFFKRLFLMLYVFSQGLIQHRLIVAPTLLFNFGKKPFNNIAIKPNSDSDLVSGGKEGRLRVCPE